MSHSAYWLDEDLFEELDKDIKVTERDAGLARIARLSSARRATANFVNILTNRNDIPVKFSSGKDSYTNGEEVIISADDNPDHFDSMVGLALHEGSHVLLSDFEFLKAIQQLRQGWDRGFADTMWYNVSIDRQTREFGTTETVTHYTPMFHYMVHPALRAMLPTYPSNGYREEGKPWYPQVAKAMCNDILLLMNVLEDRRIDAYVYQNAGGYRPYYDALYDRYFFGSDVEKNLRWNPEWRELTVENYINRLIMMIHPAASPDALPGLRHLYQLMDLATIDRLAPTPLEKEVYKKSAKFEDMPRLWREANILYVHILRFASLADRLKQNEQNEGDGQQGAGKFGKTAQQILEAIESNMGNLPNMDMSDMIPQMIDPADTTKSGKEKPRTYNAKRGENALKKAKEVLQGEVKKKKASKTEVAAAEALEHAQAKMVNLKGDGLPGGECMVTRKMSESLFNTDWFIFRTHYNNDTTRSRSLAAGKRMGQIMVHRLQVRNDPIVTKNTRLTHGGLDRRLLANLGMDITSVFQKSRIDTFKPAMIHLTLDASGSMSGRKWEKVMTVATALAFVGSKMRNIDTVITIRGGNDAIPVVCVVFDSRRDQFVEWMKWAKRLSAAGSTPEGLCFKATMELITECKATHDIYFVNFSDGEPGFSLDCRPNSKKRGQKTWYGPDQNMVSYGGELALKHTRQMVQMIRDNGVKVLSYFIGDGSPVPRIMSNFKQMYGEDAVHVNVENAAEVIRTLNKMLVARMA